VGRWEGVRSSTALSVATDAPTASSRPVDGLSPEIRIYTGSPTRTASLAVALKSALPSRSAAVTRVSLRNISFVDGYLTFGEELAHAKQFSAL